MKRRSTRKREGDSTLLQETLFGTGFWSTVRHMLVSLLAAWNTLTLLFSRWAVCKMCLSVGNPGKKMSSLTPESSPRTTLSREIWNGTAGSSVHLCIGIVCVCVCHSVCVCMSQCVCLSLCVCAYVGIPACVNVCF